MRLTCPNCDAQYEVPDEVIPPEGRDVQCSNCGDTWYQTASDSVARAASEAATPSRPEQSATAETPQETQPEQQPEQTDDPLTEDPGAEPEDDYREPDLEEVSQPLPETVEPNPEPAQDLYPDPSPTSEPYDEPVADPSPEPETQTELDELAAEDAPVEAPAHTGLARGMNPSVTGILREEAEREAKLRAAEGAGLESQPDLGLDAATTDEPSRRANQARDRMARMKGENPALLAAAESGSRRGLLPDIDEINSTLRASSDPVGAAAIAPETEHPARRKSGFSRGFAVVILLVLALVLTYTNAPQIADTLPQADPYLSTYVAWVDQARLWLDAKVSGFQSSP